MHHFYATLNLNYFDDVILFTILITLNSQFFEPFTKLTHVSRKTVNMDKYLFIRRAIIEKS